MKFEINRKIKLSYFAAFMLLATACLLLFSSTGKLFTITKHVHTTKEGADKLQLLLLALTDVETSQRGYLLMNKKEFLEKYYLAQIKTDSILKITSPVLYKDSTQTKQLKKLQLLTNKNAAILNNALSVYAGRGNVLTGDVKNAAYDDNVVMDSIRQQILSMQAYENAKAFQQDSAAAKSAAAMMIINFTSIIIAIMVALYSLLTYLKENEARQKTDEQALLYRNQQQQRIEELNAANTEMDNLKNMERFAATGRMARVIAHEVRNPLTNIALANDQLKDAVEPNEENSMLLNMIKRNGERINKLVGDLLGATKFGELNLAEFSVNDLLNDALIMAGDEIKLNDITIEKKYADNMCKVRVDAEKIKIAFFNIIVNEIETLEPGKGVLQITTENFNKICRVIIKDNSAGMNEESKSKIFEPFFARMDNSNGLGLTNTQNIILNHKGNIAVDSEPGKGTTFTISLSAA